MCRKTTTIASLLLLIIILSSIPTSYSMSQSTITNRGNIVFDNNSESVYGITITGDHEPSIITDKTTDPVIKNVIFPTNSSIVSVTETNRNAFEGNSPNGYSQTTLTSDGTHPFWIYMNALSNKNNVFSCIITITDNSDVTETYSALTLTGNNKNNPPGEAFLVMENGNPSWSNMCNSKNSFTNIKSIEITVEATSQGKSPMYLYMVVDTNSTSTSNNLNQSYSSDDINSDIQAITTTMMEKEE